MEECNLCKIIRITMCVEIWNRCEVKEPRIRPSMAGVPSRRGEVTLLFLIFLRAYPAAPLFFYALSYSAVSLFFFAFTLQMPFG